MKKNLSILFLIMVIALVVLWANQYITSNILILSGIITIWGYLITIVILYVHKKD